jgi:uncharacterized protein (TIGR00645 family)
MRPIERAFGAIILFSRWLAAPFLLGLLGCLVLLIYRFFADLFELAMHLNTAWHDLVVGILNLIDLALAANLVLIVIFSGYENFISKIRPEDRPNWPEALTRVDFGALKQRLLGSIVGIAAVDALAWYLDLEKYSDAQVHKLIWVLAFPLMFVTSMLMLAIADHLERQKHTDAE